MGSQAASGFDLRETRRPKQLVEGLQRLPWIIGACDVGIGGNVAVRASGLRGSAIALIYETTIILLNTAMFIRWFFHASAIPTLHDGVPPYSPYKVLVVNLCCFSCRGVDWWDVGSTDVVSRSVCCEPLKSVLTLGDDGG
jgi:hypothetical protein